MTEPQPAPPVPEPPWIADNLGFRLAKAGSLAAERFRAALAPLGIRPRHYSVLGYLVHSTSALTQQMVAGCLSLDPSSVVTTVDEMQRLGLVLRRQDQQDRRRNVLVVTDRGREVLGEARAIADELAEDLLALVAPADRDAFGRALRAIATPLTPPPRGARPPAR